MQQQGRPALPLVAGVDGCRGGWLVVTALPRGGGRLEVREIAVVPDFAAVLALTRPCAAVAVDIPIGLSADGTRSADFEARRRIGPRRSSVFPPPPRCILDAAAYAAANSECKARFGRGLQRQTFNILAKIREADTCMTPHMQDRIVESHPEVSFRALAGRCLQNAKRTASGREERLCLLEAVLGRAVRSLRPLLASAWDDLYDACVLTWTASRVISGEAVHLPPRAERDERGLRMEIVV